jgi:hypothetical protein
MVPAEEIDSERWQTRSSYYWVSFTSDLEPLGINRIHRWLVHVEDESGAVIDNAEISLLGGMPEHNHGLPTIPRMTESLGNGDYRVEGMRFHMSGYWELTVTVDANGRRDTVVIPLKIS